MLKENTDGCGSIGSIRHNFDDPRRGGKDLDYLTRSPCGNVDRSGHL